MNRFCIPLFIQLSQVDENQLLAVIVVDGNVIKNKLMQVERLLGNDELLKLNVLLNTFLQGASLQDIKLGQFVGSSYNTTILHIRNR